MTSLRACLFALAAAAATAGAGCAATKTDVSEGVDQLNERVLAPQGATLDCPDEVDGGEGATFDCTMRSTTGDASAPVEMRIETEGGELAVAVADGAQFDAAIEKVARRR